MASSPFSISIRKKKQVASAIKTDKIPGRRNAYRTPKESIAENDATNPTTFPTQTDEPRIDTATVFFFGEVLAQTVRRTGPHSIDWAYPLMPHSRQNKGKLGSVAKAKLLKPITMLPTKIIRRG